MNEALKPWTNEITRLIEEMRNVADEQRRPFVLLKPNMGKDGNQWSALYGDNIQEGICGYGDTPEDAARDFDNNWNRQKINVVS